MRALKARLGYLNIKLKTFRKLANSNVRQRSRLDSSSDSEDSQCEEEQHLTRQDQLVLSRRLKKVASVPVDIQKLIECDNEELSRMSEVSQKTIGRFTF